MVNKSRKKYYAPSKKARQWYLIQRIALWVLAFFLLYTGFTTFVASMRVMESDSMQPGLRAGDRFVFSSYMLYSLLPDSTWMNHSIPMRRGSIVLVNRAIPQGRGLLTNLLDEGIRFFTAQRIGLGGQTDQYYMKRIVGLPGDEIFMTNFVMRVKPRDSSYSLTEFELSDQPYDVTIPQVPALWDESIPFSGNMDKIVLGADECFVLSDERSNTNDSRTWGPVSLDFVVGKALFRYWPITRLGPP
ncbi:MAG: signal peptidase I [Treponema sp.]|jgi:signal peptidase I|nr:signal peptidase I [Treponema sp.]